jgi:nucleotidyltransferase/DNA polymerase involved in DNA repair
VAVDSTTPVTEIEGVGPSVTRALSRMRVHTVFDLLRCTPDQIRRAASHLSFADAYGLRSAASLLQVRGMSGQWAEALVKGGVKSIDELQGKSSHEVLDLLRRARRRRIIRSLPTSSLLEQVLRDAVSPVSLVSLGPSWAGMA